ncbi:MAG TPA: Ig-like domain repeat protein, partial [Pyrinomonadaceae bacterium]|nr:Ig-like domain repeat protein [Pyrinomonadaceae bacterium]
ISYRSTDRAGNQETAGSQTIMIDKTAPTARLSASPSRIFPPDGRQVTVTLTGIGSDATSGLYQVSYSVTDEYGTPLSIATRSLVGSNGRWTDSVDIEARRNGDDLNGRVYRIVATVSDSAGNTTTASVDVTVAHDERPQ